MYRIGKLLDEQNDISSNQTKTDFNRQKQIKSDFEKLRKLAIEMVSFCIDLE